MNKYATFKNERINLNDIEEEERPLETNGNKALKPKIR